MQQVLHRPSCYCGCVTRRERVQFTATASAARIAARRRVAVVVAIARAALTPAPNLTYFERESADFMRTVATGGRSLLWPLARRRAMLGKEPSPCSLRASLGGGALGVAFEAVASREPGVRCRVFWQGGARLFEPNDRLFGMRL